MDPISHSLVGVTLSNLGLETTAPLASTALLFSSLLPDLDYLANLRGRRTYLKHHRGFTHSILGIIILAGAFSLTLSYFDPLTPYSLYFLLCLIGGAGHLLLDTTTSYGTRLLLPFTKRWFAWDLVLIFDPCLLGLLVGGTVISRLIPGPFIPAVTLSLVLSYWLLRASYRRKALKILKEYSFSGEKTLRAGAFPLLSTPFRWLGVIETERAFYTAKINIRKETNTDFTLYPKPEENEVIKAAKKGLIMATFLDFARFPWMSSQRNSDYYTVRCEDLRFKYFKENGFGTEVLLSIDKEVLSERLKF